MTLAWFLGLLSGLFCAAFGMALYAGWDFWKEKRSTERRHETLEGIIGTDLAANLDRVRRNLSALNLELPMLPQRMSVVEPLPLMRTGFWEILRLEPTSKFLTVEDKATLHNLYDLTERANERLRAREEFKNHNGAMSNFPSTMQIHDDELIKALNKLNEAIMALGNKSKPSASEKPAA